MSSSVGAVSGQSVGAVPGGAVSGQCRLTLVSECRAVSEQCRSSVGQCRGFLTVDLLGQCRAVSARRSTRRPGQRPPLLAESLIVYKVFKTTDAALRMPLRLSQRHARGIQILKLPLRLNFDAADLAGDKPAAQITINGGGGLGQPPADAIEASALRARPRWRGRSAPSACGEPRTLFDFRRRQGCMTQPISVARLGEYFRPDFVCTLESQRRPLWPSRSEVRGSRRRLAPPTLAKIHTI